MKTLNKKLFLVLLTWGMLLGSCTDLTEDPYDNILTAEDIAKGDPAILDALTAPVYTRLTDVLFGWHGYFDLIEESSDVIVTPARPNGWVDGGTYRALHMHTWNSFQSQPGGLWNRCYAALNILNGAILTYKNMDGAEGLVAELRSLRALYYYLLLDSFGNIPITTEDDIGKQGFLPEQKTRVEAFEYIENELLEIMPALNEAKVYGKMNKWAAKMILAKLYLNAEVYTGTARWTDAIEQVDDIIGSGLYSLESNYHANFAVVNEGSKEQIFSVIFDKTRSGWFHYPWKTLHPASRATYNFSAEPWGGSCAIPQFIDTYDTEDARFNI
ncbi:MAG TPA: RagB/SusD family nutrient uptake outer membrane protein, partial [Cyclobacteriaceae bacterium]|nr:RagB/SusD family nutrient uptake outer membrane protein [Cyclobacteriaceae bacterium]